MIHRSPTAQEIREAARGHWRTILPALGIPEDALINRGRPCPGCGGRDRFRYDDRDGSGSFICGRGGDSPLAGDGFALLMHVYNWRFPDALRAVAGVLGLCQNTDKSSLPVRRSPPHSSGAAVDPKCVENNRMIFQRRLRAAAPLSPDDGVVRYLAGRGIALASPYPSVLRFASACDYWIDCKTRLARLPALLAAVQAPDGALAGLHTTYLTEDGSKATLVAPDGRPLPSRKLRVIAPGAVKGAAVRLYPPDGRLALAEGIETALAVHALTQLPAWACLSANALKTVVLPPDVHEVWITADHDASGTGQRAGDALARRLLQEGRRVRLVLPPTADTDWADVLQQEVPA